MILSVWGKSHGSIEGLEMKNEGEKSEIFWAKDKASRLSERHKSSSELWPLACCANQCATESA